MPVYTHFIFGETEAQYSISLFSEVILWISWVGTRGNYVNTCSEKDHSMAGRVSLTTLTMRTASWHQEETASSEQGGNDHGPGSQSNACDIKELIEQIVSRCLTARMGIGTTCSCLDVGGNGDTWGLGGRPGFPSSWWAHWRDTYICSVSSSTWPLPVCSLR